ncbi:MAG: acetate kinase, partial [Ignavibacteria bacterium]|nr:acetate kinase [Ignavibacteria bacterium]
TSIQYTSTLVNKFSGMLGISGISSDMRDIEIAAENGNERAIIAMEMYQYRVRKYIGAYAAALEGVDLIVFTGGIGENDTVTRTKSLQGLEFLGVNIDIEKSLKSRGKEMLISLPDSKVKVIVVPTDEELMIASDTYEIYEQLIEHNEM